MSIILDKDNEVVTYENQPEEARHMFPNLRDGEQYASDAEAAALRAEAAAAQAMSGTPEGYSNLVGSIADIFSSGTNYRAGDYVLYESSLYRFTADHDAGSWIGSDAQAVILADEVTELKDDFTQSIDRVTSKLTLVESKNLFNYETAQEGIAEINGAKTINSNYYYSALIEVSPRDVLRAYYKSTNDIVYTANMTKVCAYTAEDSVDATSGQDSSNSMYTVPNGIKYVQITFSSGIYATAIVTKNNSAQPTAYIPYFLPYYAATDDFIDAALSGYSFISGQVTKSDTDFWSLNKSENLFNKADVVSGKYFNPNGTNLSDAASMFASYVKLDGSGTYSFYANAAFLGEAGAKKIQILDKNKTYLKTLEAATSETEASSLYLVSLSISDADISEGAYYIGYSQRLNQIDELMIVKSATYPTDYIPFFEYWTIPDLKNVDENPLFGKKVVFDGDSICAGLGSAMGNYGNGWAGRIGVNNEMEYYNVGVSGACITAETYFNNDTSRPRHWISRYIDTIHENYPDADYIIGEGGTNDADNFYNDPAKLGTFDEADFTGPFEDTTFYGAMDSWCKKALTYFPKAKIGFIVAQKMGLGFTGYTKNRYDYFTYAEKVCKKWGIPVINLWDSGQLRPDVESNYNPTYNTIQTATEHGYSYYDGQHLTAYGYDVISPKITAWMKTL
ncbi:MAG TPA: hypothetical protein DCG33_03245 [Prevotellaceae bacterium]|nr:hypothetical protein [Prevotellaceae bacterium]